MPTACRCSRRGNGGSTSRADAGSHRWASKSRRCSSSPRCFWSGRTAHSITRRCSRCRSGGRVSRKCCAVSKRPSPGLSGTRRGRGLGRRPVWRIPGAEQHDHGIAASRRRRGRRSIGVCRFTGGAADARPSLLQHVADIPLPANLEVRDDRWDPGAETGVHEHPGPVVLAVIEGELVEETSSGRNILRAGQAFWRPARETHNVRTPVRSPPRSGNSLRSGAVNPSRQSRATTMVVQALSSLGISRAAAWRMVSRRRSPRTIGQ